MCEKNNAICLVTVLLIPTLLFTRPSAALQTPTPSATSTPAAAGSPAPPPSTTPDITGHDLRVEAIAGDQTSLDVKNSSGDALHLLVKDMIVKDRLKQFHAGDVVSAVYSTDKSLKIIALEKIGVTEVQVWVVLVGSAGVCFLLFWLLTLLHPLRLIVGEDGRYSNSKFQMAIWFAVLITTYIAAVVLRGWCAGESFVGGVNIPQNLLLLSGMSALTFAAAKGITTSKVQDAVANGVADPKNSAAAATPNFFKDLTHNDGSRLDIGDFQMLVVTLLAVGVYVVLVHNFLGGLEKAKIVTLPDVDTTILAMFGLGQGAYLTKKAVGEVGKS
jgi:hypothetical protein